MLRVPNFHSPPKGLKCPFGLYNFARDIEVLYSRCEVERGPNVPVARPKMELISSKNLEDQKLSLSKAHWPSMVRLTFYDYCNLP